MSESQKNGIRTWISENIAITVLGAIMVAIGWANNAQLSAIQLKQDKANLQVQMESNEKYVTKQWFNSEDAMLRAADVANQAALVALSSTMSDIKTDVAVIKSEVQSKNNK